MKKEVHPFIQQQNEYRASVRRNDRRRFVFYAITRPLVFIVANVSFLLLAWVIGLLQVLDVSDGVLGWVRIGVLLIAYISYLVAFTFGWLWLEKRLKVLFNITDDVHSDL